MSSTNAQFFREWAANFGYKNKTQPPSAKSVVFPTLTRSLPHAKISPQAGGRLGGFRCCHLCEGFGGIMMKWNEMTTVRKILTVTEAVSGILFWIFYLLFIFDVLEVVAAVFVLMFVNCACRIFTASTKGFRILWAVLFAVICLWSVAALLLYLR